MAVFYDNNQRVSALQQELNSVKRLVVLSKERAVAAEAVVRALLLGSSTSENDECHDGDSNNPCKVIQRLQRRILQLEDRVEALEAENRDLKASQHVASKSDDIVDALWSMLSDE